MAGSAEVPKPALSRMRGDLDYHPDHFEVHSQLANVLGSMLEPLSEDGFEYAGRLLADYAFRGLAHVRVRAIGNVLTTLHRMASFLKRTSGQSDPVHHRMRRLLLAFVRGFGPQRFGVLMEDLQDLIRDSRVDDERRLALISILIDSVSKLSDSIIRLRDSVRASRARKGDGDWSKASLSISRERVRREIDEILRSARTKVR